MRSLRWKLSGALIVVALIGIGLMSILTSLNTTSQIRSYIQSGNLMYYHRVTADLVQYYQTHQSWEGVDPVLNGALLNSTDRLVLVDTNGLIAGDTDFQWIGQAASGFDLNDGYSISNGDVEYGLLYALTTSESEKTFGKGFMGGRRTLNTTGQMPVVVSETNLLGKIRDYLWIAGLISFAAAIVLGILITRQITRPLQSLNQGAEQIARGNLQYRVKVTTRDELGDLSHSFNSMAENLEKSELARKHLISDITHELRTPLTIIEGTVDGMIDGVFPADREHLNNIKEQSTLLTRLVADLRDLSQAESGNLKLQKTPTDMNDLAFNKVKQFTALAGEKNIRIDLKPLDSPLEIEVDSFRLEQVVTNLLSNAIRHTPQGGRITVSLSVNAAGGPHPKSHLVLAVQDTGEGIPPEHIPYIFDRFYRVQGSRSRSEGGVGLGLAIVKQMVEAHGGYVQVESTPGQGSTFRVFLPLPE